MKMVSGFDEPREAEMRAKRAQRFAKHISHTLRKPQPKVLASRVNRFVLPDDIDDDYMFAYSPKVVDQIMSVYLSKFNYRGCIILVF